MTNHVYIAAFDRVLLGSSFEVKALTAPVGSLDPKHSAITRFEYKFAFAWLIRSDHFLSFSVIFYPEASVKYQVRGRAPARLGPRGRPKRSVLLHRFLSRLLESPK